jgi:4-hydroxy-2-oxoglutarate aldolase
LQYTVAQAEASIKASGINGTKWTVAKILGYKLESCATRKPYPDFSNTGAQEDVLAAMDKVWAQEEMLKKK